MVKTPILLATLKNSVFVYPTETCYGLGCDAMRADLVERVYAIKGRDRNKPVSLIVSDRKMAKQYVVWDAQADRLAERFWPGALTIVLPIRANQSALQKVLGSRTLGLRVSSHKTAQQIVAELNRAIVATSANLSAQPACYSVDDVVEQFKNGVDEPDIIIDGGVLPHALPTTVVEVQGGRVTILRQGSVKV